MTRLHQLAGYYPSLVARQFLGSFCHSIYIYMYTIPTSLIYSLHGMTSGFRPNPPRSSQVKHSHSSTQTTHVSRNGVTVWRLDVPWLSMTAEWPLNTEPNIGTGSSGSNSRTDAANGLQSLNSHFSIPRKDMRYHEMRWWAVTHWMVTHGNLVTPAKSTGLSSLSFVPHWNHKTFGMSGAASKTARRSTRQPGARNKQMSCRPRQGVIQKLTLFQASRENVSWRLRLNKFCRCIWNPHPSKTWTTQSTCPLQDEFLHILAYV